MIDVHIAWYIVMKFIIIHRHSIELLYWVVILPSSIKNCHWNQINFIECCNFIGKPLLKRYTDGICSRQIDRKVEIIVRSWKSNKIKKPRERNFLWCGIFPVFLLFESISNSIPSTWEKKCVLITMITLISHFNPQCTPRSFISKMMEIQQNKQPPTQDVSAWD